MHDRGTVKVRTPTGAVCLWNMKHQMREPMHDSIVKVLFLRHHVGHRARFRRREVPRGDCSLDPVKHLRVGQSSQYQLRPLKSVGQDGSRGGGVVADGAAILGVPKFGVVEWRHPGAFDDAYEAVVAFDGSFVAMSAENQDRGVGGYGFRGSGSRQANLSTRIRHKVLIEWSHAGIG